MRKVKPVQTQAEVMTPERYDRMLLDNLNFLKPPNQMRIAVYLATKSPVRYWKAVENNG